ncbi:MAG: PPC domain-containing protein [Planctomycetota bacterium]|nr:PPC domain-containing protein [Planctomycetota bacterium]
MSLKPAAAQIGQTTEHELSARYNLAGAGQILVNGVGVIGEIIPNEKETPEDRAKNDVMGSKCKLKFTVSADALPGVRDFRVMTPHGVSTLGQLVIARDPVVSESAENDTLDKAQTFAVPSTLCGTIEKGEDVDWYRFSVEAGSCLTFHVRSQRLQNRLHDMQTRVDPRITLRTAQGATVAASDNYYAGDPLLNYTFAQAGEYLLEVRDVRYQGNVDWTYSIEVNGRPFVTQAFPPVLIRGAAQTPMNLIGFNVGATLAQVTLPETRLQNKIATVATFWNEQPTNEFFVLNSAASGLVIVENVQIAPSSQAAATDGTQPPATQSASTPFSIPAVVAGVISTPGESDKFVFEAKVQEKFTFEVFARRLQSGLDPKIRITNEQGGLISEADDATYQRVISSDSILENWTAPADGKYILEVQDLHQRGGPSFTYAVEATRAGPYFLLEVDTDKTLLSPGMGGVIYVRTLRKNGFTGEIQLEVEGLPSGVTAIPGRIPSELNDGMIHFTAATDAPKGVSNIQVLGRAVLVSPGKEEKALVSYGTVFQEYYSPGGGRGNYPVEMHTISVAEPGDVRKITLSKTDIELRPGESQRIDVEIERAPDFKGNVTLDMIYQHLEQPYGNSLPKGVTVDIASSKTLLTAVDTKGYITLKAAADAPAISQQLAPINVHVSINFVMKHTFCERPVKITVVR